MGNSCVELYQQPTKKPVLEEIAAEESDNERAEKMQKAKKELFETLRTC